MRDEPWTRGTTSLRGCGAAGSVGECTGGPDAVGPDAVGPDAVGPDAVGPGGAVLCCRPLQ